MAYNKDFPADDSYLADFPANEREQIRAIVEDKIVNAGKLNGLNSSNDTGQVPVSNGTVCVNLNADMLDGHHADYFSHDGHIHNNASTSTAGFMSAADKTKLDGVETGAEVNQNAFGNVAVGTSTLQADNKQDTLYIAAGSNVSIAADETNDKITIGLTGIVPVANGGTGKSNLDNVNVGGAGALNSWKYRPTTANNTFADAKVRYYLATSSMTTAKPPLDGAILHLPCDNGSWDSQLFVGNDGTVSARAQNGSADWSGSTGWKKLAFEADVPKNNGTGATGTWPISVNGNANTATKATGDSDGNNIKDTYATKANTYTKTEVNTIKDNIISNPLVGNNVLWDYLHRLGANPTLPTTNAELNALGMFMSYFDQVNKIANQPSQYGQLINIPATKEGGESTQLWIEQSSGRMHHRSGNGSIAVNGTPFKRFLDTDDLSAAGVVAGNVSNTNAWWVKLGGAVPLIIQGGYGSVGKDQTATFTYPVAFPSAALGAFLGRAYSDNEISPTITSLQKSYMHWTSLGENRHSYGANTFFTVIGY